MASDSVCLVTGATGFIGGHVVERLVREAHRVRCLVRSASDTSLLDGLDVELVVGDLTDADSLRRAVTGCDYVFHCAAMVSDWALPQEVSRVNVEGTRNLMDASADASVQRVVHISSTDIYGYPGGRGIDESYEPVGFCNWYSQTKLEGEIEVLRVAARRDLEAVVLRPATVYGPRSREVILEIAHAIRSRRMILIDQGRAIAGLCFIDNLVDAAVLAVRDQEASMEKFNVTDGLDVTWRQLVDGIADGLGCARVHWNIPYRVAQGVGFSLEHGYRALRRLTGLETQPLLSRQAVHVMGIDQSFSNRKAREELGWEPRVDYAAGLAATLAWLRAEGV